MYQYAEGYISPVDRIRNSYPRMSTIQKKIANLILEQIETVCFMRLEDISKMVGVTNVTVIRFAKKIGYESFGAFKKELQNYTQSMVVPKRIVKPELRSLRETPADRIVGQAIQNELDLIHTSYNAISSEDLLEAVEIIRTSRKIFIVGTGLNEPVTEILLTRLKFLRMDAQILYCHNPALAPYDISQATSSDVFIIFSFPNYKEFSIQVAKCAQDIGCHTICITDKPTAPVAYHAKKLFLCQTSSLVYYNSMTAPVSLVIVLCGILATQIQRSPEDQERFEHISSFFR